MGNCNTTEDREYIENYSVQDPNNQFIRIYPAASKEFYTFVIIHGGFWKPEYSVDNALVDNLQPFLSKRGYGVCMVEYRRISHPGGGWPGTNDDILNSLRKLVELNQNYNVNTEKIVIMGHSAGGTLALWACSNLNSRGLPFIPQLCIALAPVGNLEEGYRTRLSDEGTAVEKYIGSPPDFSNPNCPYKRASPHHQLPLEVNTIIVAGRKDFIIPFGQIEGYYQLAQSANRRLEKTYSIELLTLDNCDHFQMVKRSDKNWIQIWEGICKILDIKV